MQLSHDVWRIARKELTLFFAAPIAYIFLGIFAAITLFVFFWGEAYFARNIADVRPIFEWMPILLIFLSAALTMRMWSEERRSGTLEFVITLPVDSWRFVLGKFLACMILLVLAIALTFPLPVTVSIIAELDWGPVFAAYLATILLGAAYISVGLFISARSDNQIVSLMLTTLICALLYLLGANALTDFFGTVTGSFLQSLGTGSRFESIQRGVIDFRDLYYYASIVVVFLALNVYSLERLRWANDGDTKHHTAWKFMTVLLAVNVLLANVWLSPMTALRADMTAGNIYSISPATKQYVQQLREPLLIRGYFSNKTHPLLAPLVPQLRDILSEYEVAGGGKIKAEFLDPSTDPEKEEQANSKYGIKPVPLQIADRHQSALVNAYFHVLIKYGDEFEVLSFQELIEIKQVTAGGVNIEVKLRNPEFDITRSIKKVLYAYQSSGNLFETINQPVSFDAYISADQKLPENLVEFKNVITKVADEFKQDGGDKFQLSIADPEAGDGALAKKLAEDYGFRPMIASLNLDASSFYYHMTLSDGQQIFQVPIPEELNEEEFKRSLESAIKRFATGFTKTVAIVLPPEPPRQMMGPRYHRQFLQLQSLLGTDLTVTSVDLKDGIVPAAVDALVLASPGDLNSKQLFAIDQFLMKGGTVIAATSPFTVEFESAYMSARPHFSGLESWLEHYGITIRPELIMDKQSTSFPLPINRRVQGFMRQELRMLDYPYFVDVRGDGLNKDNAITAGSPQVTMAWPSPIELDAEKNKDRQIFKLMTSSDNAWTTTSTNITPNVDEFGNTSYTQGSNLQKELLAVAIEGRFNSYFEGKDSPLLEDSSDEDSDDPYAEKDKDAAEEEPENVITSVIGKSSDASRIILFASNDFLSDQALRMAGASTGTRYINPLQLISNSVEWALEDRGLLSIRARSHFNRTLPYLERDTQLFWEYLNYALALLGIVVVFLVQRQLRKRANARYSKALNLERG